MSARMRAAQRERRLREITWALRQGIHTQPHRTAWWCPPGCVAETFQPIVNPYAQWGVPA